MKTRNKNQQIQGILYIIGAAFCFSLMTLFVRAAGTLPTMQKCFFRNLIAAFVSGAVLLKSEEKFKIFPHSLGSLFIRAGAGALGMIFNFYAIDHLDISDANMLNKLSPFFAIICSMFVLKEKVNKFEWFTVALAFTGAAFVVKPSFNLACVPAVIGLLGGLLAGVAYTFVRKLGMQGERSMIIVFFFSAFTCLLTLPFMVFQYHKMAGWQLGSLLLSGAAATGGQICVTKAYSKAPAKEISVYDYSQVLFAAMWGMLFFGELPNVLSIVGYCIIFGAAILKWQYSKAYGSVLIS